MIESVVDGERLALGVDNGSAGTWVSDTLTAAWLVRHADWPYATGAAGSTNFFGFPFETRGTLVRLPAIAIGAAAPVRDVAVLGLPQGLFDWYSKKSAGTVVGFLGADVIARYRLEVDFPGQMTWWQAGTGADEARSRHRGPDDSTGIRRIVRGGRRRLTERPADGGRRSSRTTGCCAWTAST